MVVMLRVTGVSSIKTPFGDEMAALLFGIQAKVKVEVFFDS